MKRRLVSYLVFGLLILVGLIIGRAYYTEWAVEKRQQQATVLLERVRTVAKLVTVEGYFSEIYDYQDYWGYDLPIFRKKALLRVKAKVSVGYDLSRIKLEARPEDRLIIIGNLPDPGILSIDHDVDYYDITEGTFNLFREEDYTRLNREAKRFIEDKARKSDLLLTAEEQANQMLDMIRFMVENAGWKLEYSKREPVPLPR